VQGGAGERQAEGKTGREQTANKIVFEHYEASHITLVSTM
jgi:hypothetical protein